MEKNQREKTTISMKYIKHELFLEFNGEMGGRKIALFMFKYYINGTLAMDFNLNLYFFLFLSIYACICLVIVFHYSQSDFLYPTRSPDQILGFWLFFKMSLWLFYCFVAYLFARAHFSFDLFYLCLL